MDGMYLRLLALFFSFPLLVSCSADKSQAPEFYSHAEQGSLAAAISYDASVAIVSTIENGIEVWNLSDNNKRFKWQHQGEGNNLVAIVDISHDASFAATSDREAFAIWDLQSGEPEGFWRIDESSVRDIAIANQGRAILVGRGNGKAMFFEPETGRRLEFLGHQEKINSVDLSPNARYALTGGSDYQAYLWDTRNGQVIYSFVHPSRVTKVMLDPYGRYAFTADSKNNARVWDLKNGEQVSQLSYLQRQKIFSAARFSRNGEYLLTGSPSRALNLWSVKTGKELDSWKVAAKKGSRPQSAVVYDVAFQSDDLIISSSSSGLAEIWKIQE